MLFVAMTEFRTSDIIAEMTRSSVFLLCWSVDLPDGYVGAWPFGWEHDPVDACICV